MNGRRLDWIALSLAMAESPKSIPRVLSRFADPLEVLHDPEENLRVLGFKNHPALDAL
jgi:hypothetical protein